jgi:hypothetical protein
LKDWLQPQRTAGMSTAVRRFETPPGKEAEGSASESGRRKEYEPNVSRKGRRNSNRTLFMRDRQASGGEERLPDRPAPRRSRREPAPVFLLAADGNRQLDSTSRAMVMAFGVDHIIIQKKSGTRRARRDDFKIRHRPREADCHRGVGPRGQGRLCLPILLRFNCQSCETVPSCAGLQSDLDQQYVFVSERK